MTKVSSMADHRKGNVKPANGKPSGTPTGNTNSYAIDLNNFSKRLKLLYSHWREHNSDLWGESDALAIATPPTSEDLRYLKSSALNIWLLGYEFPETIMVFTKKQIHVLCSQKKASLLDVVIKPAKEAVGVEVVMHVKLKSQDGTGLMDSIFRAVNAQSSSDAPVVGHIAREAPEGKLLETWTEKLKNANFELSDVTNGFSDLFAVKDQIEITNVKKAAFLTSSVMRSFVVPKVEKVIDEEKKVSHSSLMDDTEKAILEPARIKVKLKAENVDICYPPIFQSGGEFDLKPSASSNDENLCYDSTSVIICAVGSRYNSYCSNVARTFLIDANSTQSKAYEVLLKAQEAAISKLKSGNKLSAAYQAALTVVEKEAPELAANLTKTAGTGIGLEFRESGLNLNAKNDRILRPGMVFNVSLGFQNLQAQKKDPKTQIFSLLLADTVIVGKETPEVLTHSSSKAVKDVAYSFNDDDDEVEERAKPKAESRGAGRSAMSKATLRSDNHEMSKEELRRQHQAELARQKNEETARRLAGGGSASMDSRASWLREEPMGDMWKRVILVPASGGLIVAMLNVLRGALDDGSEDNNNGNEQEEEEKESLLVKMGMPISVFHSLKAASRPFLKAVAAGVTLGTGNSLGPEGPSVEIGTSIAKGVGAVFGKSSQRSLSLVAAGSAAGIASGFNAAVSGCFFAVESVLWPSPSDSSSISLTNTTSMVILSAVIASVVTEVGLGSEPAFKVPYYDFRSPTELPLYLLLGVLCGLISLTLSKCTSYMLVFVDNLHKTIGVPRFLFPILGGLAVGLIALAYPEILYWGFENVDILLESRPLVKGLSADLLLQLVVVKIGATSLCRASGLVGGYYAPSLFIGAATGMAYGKLISSAVDQSNPILHLSILEVASPQAYGLVGMAATLSGVCQVPLTSVLLLFELTQDYRIVLPLLGAVGLSSWITSGQTRRKKDSWKSKKLNQGKTSSFQQPEVPSPSASGLSSSNAFTERTSNASDLCEIESSLCIDDSNIDTEKLEKRIFVSEAMRTRYVTVLKDTLLTEAVTLMLAEKQPCAMIVDNDHILIGLLTLKDIQEYSNKYAQSRRQRPKELIVSEMCSLDGEVCQVPWTATPSMNLLSAQNIMNRYGMNQIPVVTEHVQDHRGHLVGLLDRECISLTCRALATRESLGW